MRFIKKVQPNKVKASLDSYFIAMLGKSKFGKTTFIIDLVKEHYGSLDSAILLATEIGYKTQAGVHAQEIPYFETPRKLKKEEDRLPSFVEMVDELIQYKGQHGYKAVIIDTITALERQAIAHFLKYQGDKQGKSLEHISELSFGQGYDRIPELIYAQIERLRMNGFGVFIIGHEKDRKKESKSGLTYDYTTFNVMTKTSDIIEREADFIIYGDLKMERNDEGKLISERKLRFRSDGDILAGTRFKNFPAELDLDAKLFLEEFEEAVLQLYNGDEKAVKEQLKEEKEQIKSKLEAEVIVEHTADELHTLIYDLVQGLDKDGKEKAKEIIQGKLGTVNFKKSSDTEELEFILAKIKEL